MSIPRFISVTATAGCQGSRANKGFEAERLTCEDVADGRFVVTVGAPSKNRATWACIPTSHTS